MCSLAGFRRPHPRCDEQAVERHGEQAEPCQDGQRDEHRDAERRAPGRDGTGWYPKLLDDDPVPRLELRLGR